jgi:hypothetical protein
VFLRANLHPVRLAYQPPANSTFLSQQTSHQQPASSTLLSEQTSTSHQPPANRTGCWCLPNYNNLGNFLAIILIGRGQLKSGWNTVSPIILIPNFPCVSNTFVSLFILEFGYVWE